MRLTLRTLLAYMDDMLDPADQEELGRKIESSAFATELIHRARDAARRLRLSAPAPGAGQGDDLHAGDAHLDANEMSEYLDNTLPPEAVGEFERSCLEAGPHADMLLAEAVSCHHVLTMVLGEPAEVDADLRGRMYGLFHQPPAGPHMRIEPAHESPRQAAEPVPAATPQPAVAPVAAAAPVHHTPPRPSAEPAVAPAVPDYLIAAARAQRRSRMLAVAAVLALVAGGIATWLALTPEAKPPAEIAQMGSEEDLTAAPEIGSEAKDEAASAGEEIADAEAAPPESEAPPFTPPATTPPASTPAATESATIDAPPAPGAETTSQPAPPVVTAGAPAAGGAMAPEVPLAAATSVAPGTGDAPALPPEVPAAAIAGSDAPATASVAPQATSAPPTDIAASTPVAPASTAPANGGVAETPVPPAEAGAEAAAPAEVAAAAPVEPVKDRPAGNYLGNMGDADLLLRYSPADKAWSRVGPRTILGWNDRLAVPPAFRTPLVLTDANVYLAGGTVVELPRPSSIDGQPPAEIAISIPSGRVIINSGLNGNRVEVVAGDFRRVVALAPSSSLAIEVNREFQPGGDPKRDAPVQTINWYLTSGSLTAGAGADAAAAESPSTWTTAGDAPETPRTIDEIPAWIDREPASSLQQSVRQEISKALAAGAPVNVPLLELTDRTNSVGRKREVRALAAETGALVGQFEPLVKSLADVDQRAAWKDQIETLRAAIARDPESAAAIHEAFAVQRGEPAANDLMEMLMGFGPAAVGTTPAEVKEGSLVRLINWLQNDDLTYRVLASYNINEITGTSGLGGYRPEHTASQRKREVKYYWDRLDSGELKPR